MKLKLAGRLIAGLDGHTADGRSSVAATGAGHTAASTVVLAQFFMDTYDVKPKGCGAGALYALRYAHDVIVFLDTDGVASSPIGEFDVKAARGEKPGVKAAAATDATAAISAAACAEADA